MTELLRGLEGYIQTSPVLAFVAVFIGGILISLTPCVYPIIPITIGVIGSTSVGSKTKGFFLSLVYVLGIATMYAVLGAFAALTGRLFGEIGSSPFSYLIVGNICIILALMLFEVIPYKIPGIVTQISMHKPSGRGFFAVYVLGLISGLIVGPCTAAPLGVVLTFVATKQNVFYGISLLFTFALGMGVLLIIVGTFAGLLTALPKPGPWMDRVRKGFAWLFIIIGELLLIKAGSLLM
jgi:thiol:disulfide interchange protein DsbD